MEKLSIPIPTITTNAYSCDGCAAPLVYRPGSKYLVCLHCGNKKQIAQEQTAVEELDYNAYMENFEQENTNTTKVVTCSNCEATPTVDENLKSMACPYCGSPLLESEVHQERYIKPGYVAPFLIDKDDINDILEKWAKSLWFAPNKIKRAVLSPLNLNGIYMPYWTYDAKTKTTYTGERGEAYYVTVGTGDNRRRERRVRWHGVSGTISNFYDDVLIPASRTLDKKLLSKVGDWNTRNIVKIDDSYLAGFVTEKYRVNLKQGFHAARKEIQNDERSYVKSDIGGDEQRIHSMDTKYSNIKFKHLLLPIYVSAFRYKNEIFSFYVNGRTGEIAGKRPYSRIKMTLAVILGGMIAAALIYFWIQSNYS